MAEKDEIEKIKLETRRMAEDIRAEIKELRDEIGGLRKKPEFADEVKALETETKAMEAMLSAFEVTPVITAVEEKEMAEYNKKADDIIQAISTERAGLSVIRTKGVKIPPEIKKLLIKYATWLLDIQNFLNWLASRWWVPGSIKDILKKYAKIASNLATLLIWIANNFCGENLCE